MKSKNRKKINYLKSGVNVEAGDALVDWITGATPKSKSSSSQSLPRFAQSMEQGQGSLISGIGGFASIWKMGNQMKNPCIVTCTDGVGTKVKLASYFKKYQSVGQDLVAMCVNDLICTGATPLLFLDYYASGKLNLKSAKDFLTGVRSACERSGAVLVGGETAEMPGVYRNHDFDCAGFAVGLVDEKEILGPHRVHVGDMALGISSSGFHSNGFSLLRKLYARDLKKHQKILLEPTTLYPKLYISLKKKKLEIKAMAHITGGGMENLPRALPPNTKLQIRPWTFSKAYQQVQKRSGLSYEEMLKTFNCGIGLVLILSAPDVKKAELWILDQGFKTHVLGVVEKAQGASYVEYP